MTLASAPAPRRRVVVATADTIAARMAGPAIRTMQLARALASENDVRVVTTSSAEIVGSDIDVRAVDGDGLAEAVAWCDVFVFQGGVLAGTGILQHSDKVFVADVYDPIHLEQLEQARDAGPARRAAIVRDSAMVLNEQLLRADLVLCASEKQRDFWLGQLAALGRLNPSIYDEDETLDSFVKVVPFGVDDDLPVRTGPGVKGVVPGIGPDDWLILWGGGLYNWFDPLTLVHAVDRLRRDHDDVRLMFMGVRHPNPGVPEMRVAVETRDLVERLGLQRHVVFNEGWVPYGERANVLLDADVGVSTNLNHVEAEFSFRTRMLDYLWAGLPVVATSGDALGGLIAQRGAGVTVPAGDVDALAAALTRVKTDPDYAAACRANAADLAPSMRWSVVTRPVVEFCRQPRRAPDLLDPLVGPALAADLGQYSRTLAVHATGLRGDIALARTYWAEGGPGLLVRRITSRSRRLVRERFGRGSARIG